MKNPKYMPGNIIMVFFKN